MLRAAVPDRTPVESSIVLCGSALVATSLSAFAACHSTALPVDESRPHSPPSQRFGGVANNPQLRVRVPRPLGRHVYGTLACPREIGGDDNAFRRSAVGRTLLVHTRAVKPTAQLRDHGDSARGEAVRRQRAQRIGRS
jgi:hypothetical protein